MDWKQLLAYITGTVAQELLLRNEYLVTENRILRDQLKERVRLSDGERKTLAEIGQKLGKQALADVAKIVKPDTILGWHRKFVAQKFDGSMQRQSPGRPKIDAELEALVVRMAQENRSWGYDRIVGALANLGYTISDQTVGNILKRHGLQLWVNGGTPWSLAVCGAVTLLGHQCAVPAEHRVGLDDLGHFLQRLLPQFGADLGQGLPLAVTQPHAPCDLMAQDAILCHQVFMAQQQCLIDGPRDIREQCLPIHTPCTLRLSRHPLASSMRDGMDSMQAAEWAMAGS